MRSEVDLPGAEESFVYLLPHPDDEFAVSRWIVDATRAGRPVHAVFLTDGGHAGQDVARREAESLDVLARLGVCPDHVHFLGHEHRLPDGALHAELPRALGLVRQCLSRIGGPIDLRFPAWEGGHQDHDATHLIGLHLLADGAVRAGSQFPLYRAAFHRWPLFCVMRPLPQHAIAFRRRSSWSERLQQLSLCLVYRSQWRSWIGLLPVLAGHLLVDGHSYLCRPEAHRIAASPGTGRPLYERRGFLSWDAFASATAEFRSALPPSSEGTASSGGSAR